MYSVISKSVFLLVYGFGSLLGDQDDEHMIILSFRREERIAPGRGTMQQSHQYLQPSPASDPLCTCSVTPGGSELGFVLSNMTFWNWGIRAT